MIPFCCFLKKVFVLLELLLIWERDSCDSLYRLIFTIAQPIGSGVLEERKEREEVSFESIQTVHGCSSHLQDGKCFDIAGVGDVRPATEINQGPAAIHGTHGTVRNSLVDKVLLVLAVAEHLQELRLCHLKPYERLLFLDDGCGECVQGFLILIGNNLSGIWVSLLAIAAMDSSHTLSCWPCHSRSREDPLLGVHCRGNIRTASHMPPREYGPMSARKPFCLCLNQYYNGLFSLHLAFSPSVCSKSINSSLQLFSNGRVRSHNSPSTMEMTVRSTNDFDIPFAIINGFVSHDVPRSSFPLGREMVISSRGFATIL